VLSSEQTTQFRQQTLNGISWSVAGQIGQQALRLLIGVVLARLLSPREFGLVSMVTVLSGFALVFQELGFGAAIVQKKGVEQDHLCSVFWLSLVSGSSLTILFVIVAPLVADFYGEPVLLPLTMLIAFNFLFSSLGTVQQNLMVKALEFRALTFVNLVSIGLSGGVAIVLAFSGLGVWSLAVHSVSASILTAGILWKLSDWSPQFVFRWSALRELFGFSISLAGTQTLNYWARNVDNLLIGRFLGTAPLGLYSRAYSFLLFPISNVSNVISRVMFPSLSRIQEDRLKVKRVFLRVTKVIALVNFPLLLGLLAVATPFVLALFGSQWSEMIPLVRLFSLLGITQSIGTLNGNLYLSQGRADLQLKVGVFLKPIKVLSIIFGLQWGVTGVAVCYTIASLLTAYPAFYFAGRLVGLTYLEVVRNLSPVFLCSAAMASCVWAVGFLLPLGWSSWALLGVQVLSGTVTYGALVHLFKVQAYRDLRTVLGEQFRAVKETPSMVSAG